MSLTAVVNLATVVEQLEEKPLDAVKVGRLWSPGLELHLDLGQRHRLHLDVRLLVIVVVAALVAVVLSVGVVVIVAVDDGDVGAHVVADALNIDCDRKSQYFFQVTLNIEKH